jgi:hypothetical protein
LLKRPITYTNPFTDEEVTETHYFHISKADLMEMEVEEHKDRYTSKDGRDLTGMEAKLQRIVDSEDGKAIMREFKDIIRRSYGKKDGDRFIRNQAIWEEFSSSEAYSQLLFELLTQGDSAAQFIAGVIPGNLEQIAAEVRAQATREGDAPTATSPAPAPAPVGAEDPGAEQAAGQKELRQNEIKNATAENPVLLTRDELVAMGDDEFRSGLAEGRYKLS